VGGVDAPAVAPVVGADAVVVPFVGELALVDVLGVLVLPPLLVLVVVVVVEEAVEVVDELVDVVDELVDVVDELVEVVDDSGGVVVVVVVACWQ
jgi:hypothetical protein